MRIEQALYDHLRLDAAVAALVGTRIYPDLAPQEPEPPLLVYQRISTPRDYSQSGETGLVNPRFQITCVAKTTTQLRNLADAVRFRLNGFKGTMSSGPGVSVGAVFLDNEVESYQSDILNYVMRQDYIFWHTEALS